MKKIKPRTIITIIATTASICLFIVWMLSYTWKFDEGAILTFEQEGDTSYSMSYITISKNVDKKIVFSCQYKSGYCTVGLYRVPKDHIAIKFIETDGDMVETAKLIDAGFKYPATPEGMECVESYTFEDTEEYIIDCVDWEPGIYAIAVEGGKDTSLVLEQEIFYKRYNWMIIKDAIFLLLGK